MVGKDSLRVSLQGGVLRFGVLAHRRSAKGGFQGVAGVWCVYIVLGMQVMVLHFLLWCGLRHFRCSAVLPKTVVSINDDPSMGVGTVLQSKFHCSKICQNFFSEMIDKLIAYTVSK